MFLFLGVIPIKVEESNLSVVNFEELEVDQKNQATPRLGQPNCYLPTHDRVCTYGISDILKIQLRGGCRRKSQRLLHRY